MKNIIFIGGIHGSGKGTICKFITNEKAIVHLTASEVLKWKDLSLQEDKKVSDINLTQDLLITNLKKIVNKNEQYLLDGHYCLLNKENIPVRVPIETFRDINPSKLIIVLASPNIIKERLEKRDNKVYDINLIKDFQKLELDYANEIKETLNIDLLIVRSEDDNLTSVRDFIK